jgi:hypothetical protein
MHGYIARGISLGIFHRGRQNRRVIGTGLKRLNGSWVRAQGQIEEGVGLGVMVGVSVLAGVSVIVGVGEDACVPVGVLVGVSEGDMVPIGVMVSVDKR